MVLQSPDKRIHQAILMELNELRKKALSIVDEKTRQIIARGFFFDGNYFSLSLEAQKNLLWLYILFLRGSLPETRVTTMDDRAYSLKVEKMPAFFDLANNSVGFALASGRDLKDRIATTVDRDFLKSFYDPRE